MGALPSCAHLVIDCFRWPTGMGAARDGPRRQSPVACDVFEAGRATGGFVHGGQFSLRRFGLFRRHCSRESGWGRGGYLGVLLGRSIGSCSHDIHCDPFVIECQDLLAPLRPGTILATTTQTREW